MSELRAARWKQVARRYRSDMLTALGNWRINRERAEAAEAELARVRGLLQRATVLLAESQESIGGMWRDRRDRFVKDAGAESADIGKVNRVDENLRELVKALKEACETVLSDPTDKESQSSILAQ